MKHSLLFTILISSSVAFFCGCENITVSNNDNAVKVNGNGKVTSVNRPITSFDKIEIEGVFNVYLSQKDKEGINVETDENIQPLIETSVNNNVLSVKLRDSTSIGRMKKINIFIDVKNLSKITTTGVGQLKCSDKLNINELTLDCKGVGITDLKLEGEKLTINSEIVGALKLSGEVKSASIKHAGLGVIQAFDLKTEKLTLDADGIGAAEIYASKDLTITSNGVGGVRYKGNPAVKRIKNDGIGKVEAVD